MAKAGGAKSAIAGALKAGGLRAMLGLATGKAQQETQTMLGAMVSRIGHLVPFLGDALSRGKGSKNALTNLMEIAKTMEVVITRHQQTRAKMQREAKERLELKTPAPANPTTTPRAQPRRPVNAPVLAPAPKPTFAE